MRKCLLVIFHEYRRHVFRGRFLLILLIVPLLIMVYWGMLSLMVWLEMDETPFGYVDRAGVIQEQLPAELAEEWPLVVPVISFAGEEQAVTALKEGEIQAFYLIPEDYGSHNQVQEVYWDETPSLFVQGQFRRLLRFNLLLDQPRPVTNRLLEGTELMVQSLDETRAASSKTWVAFLVPLTLAGFLFMGLMVNANYLIQSVVEEKENRTMEVLISSVAPLQLISGKIIGLIGVGLTPLAVWGAFGFGLGSLLRNPGGSELMGISALLPSDSLGLMILVVLLAYVMNAGFMAALGAAVTETSEASQMMALLTLPLWVPVLLSQPLLENPSGPLALGLSFFPLTAPVTLLLRLSLVIIPTFQLVLSLGSLFGWAVFSIWLAGKIFRMGMLRYGKRLRWRDILFFRKGVQSG